MSDEGGNPIRRASLDPLPHRIPRDSGGSFKTEGGWLEESVGTLWAEFLRELLRNGVSVLGMAGFIVIYSATLLGASLLNVSICLNLGLVIAGLSVFGVGLRQGFMPLGERIGARLPHKIPRIGVYFTVFSLGVLATLAEPAIGALRTAGKQTDPDKAPLLFEVLDSPFLLSLLVGIGVGFASVVGCMRLVLNLKIKVCLFVVSVIVIVVTAIFMLRGGNFSALTGLAWDCGAVTTGPVTVPIVLTLGIGIAASAKEAPSQAYERRRSSLRGVSMLSAIDPVVQQRNSSSSVESEETQDDLAGFGIVSFASLFPVLSVWSIAIIIGGPSGIPQDNINYATAKIVGDEEGATFTEDLLNSFSGTLRAVVPLSGFLLFLHICVAKEPLTNCKAVFRGLFFCFVGMFLFSLGLAQGLSQLGKGAGAALPNAVKTFGDGPGMIIIFSFGFLSGFGATFAEPALAAMGETVEKLTRGQFTKLRLVFAVSIGVGSGTVLGMAKIYFQLNLFFILGVGYAACLVLTYFASEEVTCVAWDSAGVTTGPVTVPIVLAVGLALGKVRDVADGFGILSCASIGPILTVLAAGISLAKTNQSSATSRGSAPADPLRENVATEMAVTG